MRNRTLDLVAYSVTLATLLRLAVFAIIFWAAIDVSNWVLRFLLSVLAAIQIVMTVRRVIIVRQILKRLDELGK